MLPTLTYRLIEPADCAALETLHHSSFSDKDIEASIFISPQVATYLAQLVAFPELQCEHWLWGAWEDSRLVGYVYGRALTTSWHLSYLGVLPDCQERGIGQSLWSKWHKTGFERGYRCFTVDVEKDNPRALSWYQRMGYCSTETTWFYREQLVEPPELPTFSYELRNWENAHAWQVQYGFSQFELSISEKKWSIGRLADKYFRAAYPLPDAVKGILYRLDPARQLLLMSSQQVAELEELKVSYRLRCEV